MKKRLALIGTKEFSDQIIHFAESTGEFEFVGYFDDLVEKGTIINGFPVFGKVEDAILFYKDGIFSYIFIGIGYTRFDLRQYYYELLKGKVPFANIIMPRAEIDVSVKLGEGVYIGDRCVIGRNVLIEDNVFIHERTSIAHNCRIGSHTYFSGIDNVAGNVCIGNRVFVGMSVDIADSLTIVDDVWIGVGCVVVQNLEREAKYMSPSIRLIPVQR